MTAQAALISSARTPGPAVLIGNDVVCLRSPEARAKHADARFVGRVLAPAEQAMLARAANPAHALWALWAAKEAAYKIAAKLEPGAIFAHARFEVDTETLVRLASARFLKSGACRGSLRAPRFRVAVAWDAADARIHAVATLSVRRGVTQGRPVVALAAAEPAFASALSADEALSAYSPESRALRLLAKRTAAHALGVAPARIEIVRPGAGKYFGPPELRVDGARLPGADLSLSHDGAWLAVALIGAGASCRAGNRPTPRSRPSLPPDHPVDSGRLGPAKAVENRRNP